VSIGATYVYTSEYDAVAPSCPFADATRGCFDSSNSAVLNNVNPAGGRIPASNLLNLSVNWENAGGLPLDASFFMTNVTNEVYLISVNDNSGRSFRSGLLGEPRMYGFRLRYKFGQ
jgi:iron complex outermembrane receptor protein